MSERTLEYGSNIREDFYKILYHVLINHGVDLRKMPGFTELTAEQKRGIKVALDNFAEVIVTLAFVPSTRMGQVNPVHRPVVEELMADLQAMLDKMPAEEVEPEQGQPAQISTAVESAKAAGAKLARQLISAGADPLALASLCKSMSPDQPQPEPDMSAASTRLGRLLGGEGRKKPKGIFSLYDGV